MSFNISVEETNLQEVAGLLSDIGGRLVDQARVTATNKTLAQVRTGIRRDVRVETGVPSKELTKRFKLHRAKRNRKEARLFIGTMPIAAIKLGAKQTRRGVSHRGARGKSANQGAFISTMPSGHRGVFKRRGPKRLPIDEQRVPIAGAALRSARQHVNQFIPANYPRLFQAELGKRVSKEARKRRL